MFLKLVTFDWVSMMAVTEWLLLMKISPTSEQAGECNCLVVSCVTTSSYQLNVEKTWVLELFSWVDMCTEWVASTHLSCWLLVSDSLREAQQLPWFPQAFLLPPAHSVAVMWWLVGWALGARHDVGLVSGLPKELAGCSCQASLCSPVLLALNQIPFLSFEMIHRSCRLTSELSETNKISWAVF